MVSKLCPCSACGRHVRATDSQCPFCDASTDALRAGCDDAAPYTGRATRAAALLFGASLTAAACTPNPETVYGPAPMRDAGNRDAASDAPNGEPVYGPGPIPDAGAPDATKDAPNAEPVYGPGPNLDSGGG